MTRIIISVLVFLSLVLAPAVSFAEDGPGFNSATPLQFNPFGSFGGFSGKNTPKEMRPENFSRPHLPGFGPGDIMQLERYIKQAGKGGFTVIHNALLTLKDEVIYDDEDSDGGEDGEEYFFEFDVEDMKEVRQSVLTALNTIKPEANVPAPTKSKTRAKKSLIKSVSRHLERTIKNLDREIKRMEREKVMREEMERKQEEMMEREFERRKRMEEELRSKMPQPIPVEHLNQFQGQQPEPIQAPIQAPAEPERSSGSGNVISAWRGIWNLLKNYTK